MSSSKSPPGIKQANIQNSSSQCFFSNDKAPLLTCHSCAALLSILQFFLSAPAVRQQVIDCDRLPSLSPLCLCYFQFLVTSRILSFPLVTSVFAVLTRELCCYRFDVKVSFFWGGGGWICLDPFLFGRNLCVSLTLDLVECDFQLQLDLNIQN